MTSEKTIIFSFPIKYFYFQFGLCLIFSSSSSSTSLARLSLSLSLKASIRTSLLFHRESTETKLGETRSLVALDFAIRIRIQFLLRSQIPGKISRIRVSETVCYSVSILHFRRSFVSFSAFFEWNFALSLEWIQHNSFVFRHNEKKKKIF